MTLLTWTLRFVVAGDRRFEHSWLLIWRKHFGTFRNVWSVVAEREPLFGAFWVTFDNRVVSLLGLTLDSRVFKLQLGEMWAVAVVNLGRVTHHTAFYLPNILLIVLAVVKIYVRVGSSQTLPIMVNHLLLREVC